jgi:protein-S-isoprenylcysteine O-methyltransferase
MAMGWLRDLAFMILMIWLVLDSLVVFGRRTRTAKSADRLSLVLIVLANWVGLGFGTALAYAGVGLFRPLTPAVQCAGIVIMLAGIGTRSIAVFQLGRYHMPNVATYSDHKLIDSGLYGLVRHPSYLGAFIAFLGYGLGLGSWLATTLLLATSVIGYLYRIKVEEDALIATFGEQYLAYMRRTRRLIPWIY